MLGIGRFTAPVGWTPAKIANTKLWVVSDKGTTIAAGRISAWADQSGVGNNLTGDLAWTTGVLNGYAAPYFDSYLTKVSPVGFPLGNVVCSFGIVFKIPSFVGGSGLFGYGTATKGDDAFGGYLGNLGTAAFSMEYAGGQSYGSSAGLTENAGYYIVGTKNAGAINTTSALYLNGTLVTPTSAATTTPDILAGDFCLGKWVSSVVCAGYILEFIFGTGVWSAETIAFLNSYFATRYGL